MESPKYMITVHVAPEHKTPAHKAHQDSDPAQKGELRVS
jgi:hypothetical protein